MHRIGIYVILAFCAACVALVPNCIADAPYTTPTLVTGSEELASWEPLALAGPATLVGGYEEDKTDVVRSFTPGRPPTVVARVHPPGEGRGHIIVTGSPERIALFESGIEGGYKNCCTTFYQRLVSGLLDGPLIEPEGPCPIPKSVNDSAEFGVRASWAIALDQETLAYYTSGCVVVQDFASGLQRIIPLQRTTFGQVYQGGLVADRPTGGALIRVAGGLVAYRTNPLGGEGPAAVAVYDIDSGHELYRVALPLYDAPFAPYTGLPTFALQADGTLVIADDTTCEATVSTIAHPAPKPLGIEACEVDGLSAGRALIVTPAGGANHDRTLAWTSLEAPLAHSIADVGAWGLLKPTATVMDETSVAYVLNGCWMPSVYRTALSDPCSPPAPPNSCPVLVAPRYASLTAKTLRVRIRCPLGCDGTLQGLAGAAWELIGERGGTSLGAIAPYLFSAAPGHSVVLTFRPRGDEVEKERGTKLLRRLRRRRGLDVRLDFFTATPASGGAISISNAPELGVALETHTHVVIPVRLASR